MIKYYSQHSGSSLWVLACWHGKQNPAVISIDSPYHLEPVNGVVSPSQERGSFVAIKKILVPLHMGTGRIPSILSQKMR